MQYKEIRNNLWCVAEVFFADGNCSGYLFLSKRLFITLRLMKTYDCFNVMEKSGLTCENPKNDAGS
jgi:hypothetical protein